MKPLLVGLWLLAVAALADETNDPPAGRQALDELFSERGDLPAFEAALAKARAAGASPQALLEARFLYHVDRHEDTRIAALLPEFIEREKNFRVEDSEIFAVTEDWLAVVEYVRAIDALQRNDRDAFKHHITEAFWLSPRQGAAFAPHIERLRLAETLAKVTVKPTRTFTGIDGRSIPVLPVDAQPAAVLVHFWSPFSRECEATLQDFATTAAALAKSDIRVITLVVDGAPSLAETRQLLQQAGFAKPPGLWAFDPAEPPLARELRVQSVPTFVLLGIDGKPLAHGHPAEDTVWRALRKIDPAVARPAAAPGH